MGGHDGSNTYLAQGFTYDPVLNVTADLPSMPSGRSHFAAGSTDNVTLVVVGGYSSEANESSNAPEKCSLMYNKTANSWSNGACLTTARGATCGWALKA